MAIIRYGYTDWTLDVTDKIRDLSIDSRCSLQGIFYNDVFTDPIPNIQKSLVIEEDTLSSPIRIMENTPIIIDMRDERYLDTVVIYGGSDTHESFNSDMKMLEGRKILRYENVTEEHIKEVASTYPDSLIVVLSREDDMTDFDYIIANIDQLIRVAEILPSINVICRYRYTDNSLSSSSFCARASSILSHLRNGRWTISLYTYMEWDSESLFNVTSMYSTRVRKPSSSDKKFLKIDPLICRYGLLNQLNNICNALVLGHMTGRDVLEPRFNTHYNAPTSVPFSYIIDIYCLNNYLKSKNIYASMTPTIDVGEASPITDIESMPVWYSSMQDVANRIPIESPVVNIGCSMPNILRTPEAIDILANMKFSRIFCDAASYSMGNIDGEYCCLHLRLEDDWISLMHASTDFNETSQYLLHCYEIAISSVPEDIPIYICTGLGKSPNVNDPLLEHIKQKYPRALTSRPWRMIYDLPEGREIDAIVDYIIGTSAHMMIGDGKSTFSLAIACMMKAQNKQYILI